MAQSPQGNASSSDILRYDLGWKAINDLLREGRSLSGSERNCCFINLGGHGSDRFADMSAALNLDYADDGRVIALSDWDFDGDLDFWIANRSGPQIRYLRNDVADGDYVAFRLRGKKVNKDAIGARVSLITEDGQKQTQTLRAGEGYLSQSSKWLHFGLGKGKVIQSLTIHWPGGESQTLKNLQSNQRYLIFEGDTDARMWEAPKVRPLKESPITEPPLSDKARLVLLSPLPLPELEGLTKGIEKARLVNLWASWCPTCQKELSEWGESADEIAQAGLEIVAVNADEQEDKSKWEAVKLPFDYRFASTDLVSQFDVIQRSLLSRQRPLPVPCSFLIDHDGLLRAIYKGPVSAEQVIADMQLIGAPPAHTLAAALPMPGLWMQPPGGSSPQHIAIKFLEGGFLESAQSYLEGLVKNTQYQSAGLCDLLGGVYLDQKRYGEAADSFRQALRLDPADRKAHQELGSLLLAARKGKLAEPHFTYLLSASPNDPDLLFQLSQCYFFQGKTMEGKDVLKKAALLAPSEEIYQMLGDYEAQLGLFPDAVESFQKALQLNPDGSSVGLASAYAGQGDFQRAISLLSKVFPKTPEVEECLRLYREGKFK